MEGVVIGSRNPDPGFWTGRPVLVTGHTGFKGAWLCLWLARLGARVTGFAHAPPTSPSLFALAGLAESMDDRRGDVRDLAALRACLEAVRPEIVLHMAAQALVRPAYAAPVETYATNVMGTVHLLEAVRASPSVRAVVVVTSDKVYENREGAPAHREDAPLGGRDPYSSAKACAELVTQAYRAAFFGTGGHPARVASARAGNVIGGGDHAPDRLVPDAVRAFARGEAVALRAPRSIRPWQHVLEPLAGYLLLAEALCGADGAACAEGWNFGPAAADHRPVAEVVEALARAWGPGAGWRPAPGPHPHEAAILRVDAAKARARLGWDRRLPLARALDWTGAWYRAQGAGGAAAGLCLRQIAEYEALAPAPAALPDRASPAS